jgi:hypothetical protein
MLDYSAQGKKCLCYLSFLAGIDSSVVPFIGLSASIADRLLITPISSAIGYAIEHSELLEAFPDHVCGAYPVGLLQGPNLCRVPPIHVLSVSRRAFYIGDKSAILHVRLEKLFRFGI